MLLLLPILLYFVFILWIAYHWLSHPEYLPKTAPCDIRVSVIIPFRNEKENLPQLIQCLKAQSYKSDKLEYLFVNDHSDDGGEDLLRDFTLLQSSGKGKKAALNTALAKAQGELIITLDADCIVGEEWLKTLLSFYAENGADLVICPITLAPLQNTWDKLQALEFQSLTASTAGAALGQHAIMCNGANLLFKRSLVDFNRDVFKTQYVSGDDMFLLEHAKSIKASIAYLKNRQAMAYTAPVNWQHFWRQRLRWSSKSGAYSDVAIIVSAFVVLMVNVSLLILPFFSPFYLLIAFALKMLVDFLLLNSSSSFFRTSEHLWLYFLLLPIYPIYIVFTAFAGIAAFFTQKA